MAKQLSLPERYVIERMLHQDYSFASIGRNLDRSASTIAREVLHYRCFTSRIPIMGENDCINRPSCQRNTLCPEMGVHGCFASRCKRCPEGIICTSICDNYESFQCDLLDKPPYVCSNCKMQKGCKKNKAYYSAHKANAAHHKSIKDAHSGVRKTPKELREIAEIIEPLIAKGQSLNHICQTHADELGVSERTLYNYIDKNVFKVRNIDLPKIRCFSFASFLLFISSLNAQAPNTYSSALLSKSNFIKSHPIISKLFLILLLKDIRKFLKWNITSSWCSHNSAIRAPHFTHIWIPRISSFASWALLNHRNHCHKLTPICYPAK